MSNVGPPPARVRQRGLEARPGTRERPAAVTVADDLHGEEPRVVHVLRARPQMRRVRGRVAAFGHGRRLALVQRPRDIGNVLDGEDGL